MAFGDYVKAARNNSDGKTSYTVDLGSNPASGNLLIAGCTCGISGNTLSTPPSGFTLIGGNNAGTLGTWYIYYKISAGTEQSTNWVWNTTAGGSALVAEFEWGLADPFVEYVEDVTNISSVVNSCGVGTKTPSGSRNLCMAIHCSEGDALHYIGQAVDGSWNEWSEPLKYENSGETRGAAKIATLTNQTGSLTATHTDTDTGGGMYGMLAVFNTAEITSVSSDDVIGATENPWNITGTGFGAD